MGIINETRTNTEFIPIRKTETKPPVTSQNTNPISNDASTLKSPGNILISHANAKGVSDCNFTFVDNTSQTDKVMEEKLNTIQNFYNDPKLIENIKNSKDSTLMRDVLYAIKIIKNDEKANIVLKAFLNGVKNDAVRDPGKEMVTIQGASKKEQMKPEVAERYKQMAAYIKEQGYKPMLFSAYRSTETQKGIFNRTIPKYGSATVTAGHVAPAGTSRHQLGTDLDIRIYDKNGKDVSQVKFNELTEKFGFVRPYYWEGWHITLKECMSDDFMKEYGKDSKYAEKFNSDDALWGR